MKKKLTMSLKPLRIYNLTLLLTKQSKRKIKTKKQMVLTQMKTQNKIKSSKIRNLKQTLIKPKLKKNSAKNCRLMRINRTQT